MELRLWKNVNKKRNSTLVINREPDATFDVVLKDDTSVDTPTFLLDNVDLSVNYAWWEGRFYFVEDIRRGITHQYELECTTDYLATFKSYIGNYTAFVERAASNYDVYINDSAVSQRQNYLISQASKAVDMGAAISTQTGGCFIIRVIGNQNIAETELQGAPGITSFLVSPWKLLQVLRFLFTDSNFTDILSDAAVKAFFNPFQYIADITWVPIDWFVYDLAHPNALRKEITIGWFTSGITGIVLPNESLTWSGTLPTIAKRYNDFRDTNSNWTRFQCYAPLVGNFEIDPVDYYAGDLYYCYFFDELYGDGLFTITHGNDRTKVIYNQSVKFGHKIQIGQVATDMKNILSGLAGGTMAIASGNYLSGATSLISGISNIVQPTPSISGQRESRVNYYYSMSITLTRYSADTADFPVTVAGRPLCRNVLLSTLSGFVQCAGASVDIPGFAGDKEAVNNALNGGFYYE